MTQTVAEHQAPIAADRAPTNADVVRRAYAALAAGDVAALLAVNDPAVRVTQTDALPWGGTFDGPEGFARFFAGVRAHLDSAVTVERMIEAGDQVAVVGRTRGTVRANGAAFDVPLVHLYTLRERRIVRAEILIDTPAMLERLGAG